MGVSFERGTPVPRPGLERVHVSRTFPRKELFLLLLVYFFFFFITRKTRVELSDTQVYEPETRALLGTDSHFCEVVVLKLRTAPRVLVVAYVHRAGRTLSESGPLRAVHLSRHTWPRGLVN